QRNSWMAFAYGSVLSGAVSAAILVKVLTNRGHGDFLTITNIAVVLNLLSVALSLIWKESSPLAKARKETEDLHIAVSETALQEKNFFETAKGLFSNKRFSLIFVAYVLSLAAYSITIDTNPTFLAWYSEWDPRIPAQRMEFQSYYSLVFLTGTAVGCVFTLGLNQVINSFLGEKNILMMVAQPLLIVNLAIRALAVAPVNKDVLMFATVCNNIAEAIAHPAFVYLASIYGSSFDRGSVLGTFQLGNSIGRSVFSIVHGYIFDYSFKLCYGLTAIYPGVAILLVALCPFKFTRQNIDKEARKQREQMRKASAVSSVYKGTTTEHSAVETC
ncbi:hypothetical protein KIPB_009635, partial [Kipferlia bialata]